MGRVLRRKDDDRLARFAVLYLAGTTEDPACGAHEAFLSEITAVADDFEDFSLSNLDDALAFLSVTDPFEPALPPRLVGEPRRALPAAVDDEGFDAAAVLAIRSGTPGFVGHGA